MHAENSPPPAADRVDRRVRAAGAREKGRPRPDGLTPGPITFAGTRTITETAAPPPTVFHPPYGSPYGSYYAPEK
ncbi:hypothetical protein AB0F15_34355 [Amycolatopsis sp. NPDC026612]|uniref:hypothetical protein n=1 Tax=Amycolatopsis sp. NPDC026612 TaxID=3155466 RepID=UPI00340061E5